MRAFRRPVRIIFGEADPYLNADVARYFHGLFPDSELLLLPTARHFPQLDEPEEVARLSYSVSEKAYLLLVQQRSETPANLILHLEGP